MWPQNASFISWAINDTTDGSFVTNPTPVMTVFFFLEREKFLDYTITFQQVSTYLTSMSNDINGTQLITTLFC